MPQVLSMTPKPGESTEDFAARAGDQVNQFFGSTEPAPTADGTSSDTATDVPADQATPDQEPAPSS
jgi:hypothetical protein